MRPGTDLAFPMAASWFWDVGGNSRGSQTVYEKADVGCSAANSHGERGVDGRRHLIRLIWIKQEIICGFRILFLDDWRQ